MSPKIGIQAPEITAVLDHIAPLAPPRAGTDALDLALMAMQAREKRANRVRVIVYRYDVGTDVETDAYQKAIISGEHPMHEIARALDCDLQLIELGNGAFSPDDGARACAFGMMAAEEDTGLLVVAAFGADSCARADNTAPDHFLEMASPETAALYGAMIGAARAGIPVVAEGPQGKAAALAMRHARPDLCTRIFLCGITDDVKGLPVFADTHTGIPGETAVTLAALIQSAFYKAQKAA